MRILGICGALSARSGNAKLLREAARRAPANMELIVDDVLPRLPLFNPDLEDEKTHPLVDQLRHSIDESDALLIVCPEYGFSLPGALKNAIDWLIGSGELECKRIATTALVAAEGRGLRGLAALHETLTAVKAELLWKTPIARGAPMPGVNNSVEHPTVQAAIDDLLSTIARGCSGKP